MVVLLAAAPSGDTPLESTTLTGLVSRGLRLTVWTGGALVALAAAGMGAPKRRSPGLAWLFAQRGWVDRERLAARAGATGLLIAGFVGLPWVLASLARGAVAREPRCVLLVPLVVAFAAVAGLVLGALATACSELAAARGRLVFVALVGASFLLEDAWGAPPMLPGVLDAFLTWVMRASSGAP